MHVCLCPVGLRMQCGIHAAACAWVPYMRSPRSAAWARSGTSHDPCVPSRELRRRTMGCCTSRVQCCPRPCCRAQKRHRPWCPYTPRGHRTGVCVSVCMRVRVANTWTCAHRLRHAVLIRQVQAYVGASASMCWCQCKHVQVQACASASANERKCKRKGALV